MENLSLKDRRRRQSIAFASKQDSYDSYISRLPTPEESTGSHRSSDDERRNKVTRRHSPERTHARESSFYARRPDQMYQRPGQMPDSPPYQPSDSQRQLPPLRTVFGPNLSSPPRSPNVQCSSVQPSPQEPAYTSATYKPPSLYPQKKQRTGYQLEPVPPFSASSNTSSPPFPPESLEGRNNRAPPNDAPLSPRSRRHSTQQYAGYSSTSSPRLPQRPAQPPYAEPSPPQGRPRDSVLYSKEYGTASSPLDRGLPPVRQNLPYEASRDGYDRRRDSTRASYEHTPHQRRHGPPESETGPRVAGREGYDTPRYGRLVELAPCERQPEAHYPPYQSTQQPSFFMPSQYDYRQGRARKRSNLPKTSTEIMKTWFDQNIANPYPSEEQKAIFSGATGITTTQVSNWFINHRRRCPELRDKRERTRGRECEI